MQATAAVQAGARRAQKAPVFKPVFDDFETYFKRFRLTLGQQESNPLRYPSFFPTNRVTYRGYALEVRPATTGWRIAVYPQRADLPILRRSEILCLERDIALAEAKGCIDGVLKY